MKKRSKKLLLLALVTLGGCSDEAPAVVQSFATLHYEYLPKIRLNVGTIDVQDRSQPVSPQDIAASSPAVPSQVLVQMGRDRLFAAGTAGSAVFAVDQASVVREANGTLDGHLAVHLDLIGPAGTHAGFAEAQVSRQFIPGTEPQDGSASLYGLTRQMTDDMNVELEYQVKHSLGAFLVAPGSAPAAVTAQPLSVPGAPTAVPAPPALPPGQPGDAAPAAEDGYQDPAAPQQMSPPPGYLQVPPG